MINIHHRRYQRQMYASMVLDQWASTELKPMSKFSLIALLSLFIN